MYVSDNLNGEWNDEPMAREQYENAVAEMEHWQDYECYTVFVDACKRHGLSGGLWDIGCGAGQYGRLWLDECGGLAYGGTDHVHQMGYARKMTPELGAAGWLLQSEGTSVVLASASLEYTAYPPAELWNLIKSCIYTVIIHRVRFQAFGDYGAFVSEPAWGDKIVPMWRWNRDEFNQLLKATGREVEAIHWEDHRQWTFVISPR